MKFKCPACGQIINRDMRTKIARHFVRVRKGVRFYRSFCHGYDAAWCREVKT
jgi:predicted RNA-binding Zn-ribbon protein involved in translation (DUF1610 family)